MECTSLTNSQNYTWNINFYIISKLSVNDYAKHVILLNIMGHAVNKLYIYI